MSHMTKRCGRCSNGYQTGLVTSRRRPCRRSSSFPRPRKSTPQKKTQNQSIFPTPVRHTSRAEEQPDETGQKLSSDSEILRMRMSQGDSHAEYDRTEIGRQYRPAVSGANCTRGCLRDLAQRGASTDTHSDTDT